jgi:hypothetical protein
MKSHSGGCGVLARSFRGAARVMLLLASLLAAFGCSSTPETEPLATESDEIVNGTTVSAAQNPKTVALYHQAVCEAGACCPTVGQMYWFPRPCSAMVLRSLPGETWILTAHHCVTRNGEIDGAILQPTQLRVNASLSPGLALPNPPAGSFVPDLVVPELAADLAGYDIALVRVPAAVPVGSRRVSLPMNDKLNTSQNVVAFGYGRFVETSPPHCETGASGAGVLRTAQNFRVTSVCAGCGAFGSYEYFDSNALGQSVWRGDSGGPSFLQSTVTAPFLEVVGVHSSGCLGCDAESARVAGAMNFIGAYLTYFYVSANSSPTFNLGVVGAIARGARVTTHAVGDSLNTRWFYERSTRRIYTRSANGTRYFLTASGMPVGGYRFTYITDLSVAGGSQTWDLALDRLWNLAPGPTGSECLRESPTFVAEVGPCTGGPTRTFSWHPHP